MIRNNLEFDHLESRLKINDRKWRSMNGMQRHLRSLIFKRFEEVKLQIIFDHWYTLKFRIYFPRNLEEIKLET